LLNFRGTLAALGDAVHAPPYSAPPCAPVLYIRPANTWSRNGAPIVVPKNEKAIEVGATFGIVFSRAAARIPARQTLDYVAGFAVVNDMSLPHASFYRPAIRERCQDGFCCIGTDVVPLHGIADANALRLRAYVNDELRQEANSRDLVRSVPQLIADVCEFMTLMPGDLLLVGVPDNPPLARAGDTVRVEVQGIGRLDNPIVAVSEQSVAAAR
jgi:5-oxopent-3-ene-1,2,5-tricarboxylate decarboxylase/2-hydroxyhepta-2,4-diene-1,7-dioate isomerase